MTLPDDDASAGGITVRGVRRSFGEVHAVRDATFRAGAGRVTGLVGPNGSGKTTLLLMLASLLQPDDGEIRIDGIDPSADAAAVRLIMGWMPDALGAWPALTARETLVVTSRLYGLARPRAANRAAALLREVGLDELADAPARVLSRGQKQRLGLARALVHDPRVLLLDEPASGLDPQARVELRVLLRRFAAEGRTVLLSSHVLSELEEVVDDAVFLLDGATAGRERVARAAARTRDWRLRIADADAAGWAARVAEVLTLPAAASVDRRDLLVPFTSEGAAAEGLRALVTDGIPVTEFAPARGDLEGTLLDLGAAPHRAPGDPPSGAPTAEDPS